MIGYKSWAIPEGNVVKVTDESGAVIWAVSGGDKVILQVEKITSDTYAGETTYTGEQFILLDIYPKTNGTVSVTYGGLTKTITDTSGAAEPNAQQVFFGTFNGVSDSVATPASGELTIEGDYRGFGTGTYAKSKSGTTNCLCISAVVTLGNVEIIPNMAFSSLSGGCTKITEVEIPLGVTSIGNSAFYQCTGLTSVTIPDGVTSIGTSAFNGCSSLTHITIPSSIISIGGTAFSLATGDKRTVIIMSPVPPTLGNEFVFDEVGTHTIIVPIGSGAVYKAAEGWSKYADYIVEAS